MLKSVEGARNKTRKRRVKQAQTIQSHRKSLISKTHSCRSHSLIPDHFAKSVGRPQKAGGGSIPFLPHQLHKVGFLELPSRNIA
jgi:hypothetical protein